MTKITTASGHQTVITTFEMTPGTCQELLELLQETCANFISRQPGFISQAIHVNDAQTRIASYSQWDTRDHFKAMLRSPEMQGYSRKIAALVRSFEPVMYDVAATFGE